MIEIPLADHKIPFAKHNPTFLIYCTAISFAFVSNELMFVILPRHMLHEHFTRHDVMVVLIVFGGVELIARLEDMLLRVL
jgi:hypothetical protein